jgi:starch-binding outer membrane protein, SusD/RagB family
MALDYLILINTRDTNGVPILASLDVDELAPIAQKPAVLEKISSLLDEGKTHLAAGGTAFPFPLSSGFAGFDTPASFLKFNRALKARVEAYRGNHAAVLTALGESFITADAMNPRLTLGVYHAFGTGSGDTLNGLLSSNIYAHPSIVTDAEKNGTEIDARVTAKIRTVPEGMQQMHKSDKAFTMYQSITSPIPIIRNEELILLRAEANIGMEKFDDAETDINFIRVQAGGLTPRNDLNATNAVDELLKQRRYSLLFEGHRWIDARRFNKLSTLPVDVEGDKVHALFPIPQAEQDARK